MSDLGSVQAGPSPDGRCLNVCEDLPGICRPWTDSKQADATGLAKQLSRWRVNSRLRRFHWTPVGGRRTLRSEAIPP
jgi:hypothetical protein